MYVYFYEIRYQDKSIDVIVTFSNSKKLLVLYISSV
jgi:hypothetical protein